MYSYCRSKCGACIHRVYKTFASMMKIFMNIHVDFLVMKRWWIHEYYCSWSDTPALWYIQLKRYAALTCTRTITRSIKLAEKVGMAPVLIASLHASIQGMKSCNWKGCHVHLLSKFFCREYFLQVWCCALAVLYVHELLYIDWMTNYTCIIWH